MQLNPVHTVTPDFFKIYFNGIIFPCMTRSFKCSLFPPPSRTKLLFSLRFSDQDLILYLNCPRVLHVPCMQSLILPTLVKSTIYEACMANWEEH
jgi:hypothetical protein